MNRKRVIRILALGLFFVSVGKCWAGIPFYLGFRSFRQGQYLEAVRHFQRVPSWDAKNPERLLLLGESAWREIARGNAQGLIPVASQAFRTLSRELPFLGKPWYYLADLKRREIRKEGRGFTATEWKKIEIYLEKALIEEPGSAWLLFQTGIFLLSHDDDLTPQKHKRAMGQLKRASAILPDRYLGASLRFLWQRYRNPDLLKAVTAPEVSSYKILVNFLEENRLWQYREDVFRDYLKLWHLKYEGLYRMGLSWLERGDFSRAFSVFREASWMSKDFWMTPVLLRSRLGMLAARAGIKNFSQNDEESLRNILESEEEDYSELLPFFEVVIPAIADPYLRGLLAFRSGRFLEARQWWAGLPPDSGAGNLGRYLVSVYWETGERGKAVRLAKETVTQQANDARLLTLLARWDSPFREEASQKMLELVTSHRPASAWWGRGFLAGRLDKKGKVGTLVQLRPGKSVFRFRVRGEPDDGGFYGTIQMTLLKGGQYRWLAGEYVNRSEEYEITAAAQTPGGKYWLEAELLNGNSGKEEKAGPVVVLGSFTVTYPEEMKNGA